MPRTARRETPTGAELDAAASAGLVIEVPKPDGRAKETPRVWYWSVRGWPKSWLGAFCPATTWWWTYSRLPGHDFRGQSGCFGEVLAVFRLAREAWLERRRP